MQRLPAWGLMLGFCLFLPAVAVGDDDEKKSSKEALQALNDFIGRWKGVGAPEKPRPDPRDSWNETLEWTWRFKGDDAWLVLTVKNGRHLQGGELRYLSDKQRYRFTAIGKDGKKPVYEGQLKDEILTLERTETDKKENQRLVINLAGDGVRFIYRHEHKAIGRTIYVRDYQVGSSKEGESLAAKEKKNECVVSGGLGKTTVTYKGVTYYVCCSGCRDAFLENPEKYIKEYEARKMGKK
jgi:YHS domain